MSLIIIAKNLIEKWSSERFDSGQFFIAVNLQKRKFQLVLFFFRGTKGRAPSRFNSEKLSHNLFKKPALFSILQFENCSDYELEAIFILSLFE